ATRLLFFFQAEDGIRDRNVTGVQTCALPIFQQAPVATVGCVLLTGITARFAIPLWLNIHSERRRLREQKQEHQETLQARKAEYEIGRASCRERVNVQGGAGTTHKNRVGQEET